MALEECQPVWSRGQGLCRGWLRGGLRKAMAHPHRAIPWIPVCLLPFLVFFLHSLHFSSKGHNEKKCVFGRERALNSPGPEQFGFVS